MTRGKLNSGVSQVSLFAPVGPVAEAFVMDERLITAIMGPYGSAKTTSCIRKAVMMTLWQTPGPDGVRRSRGCVVRDTYAQLEANVLESWFTWFPKDLPGSTWNGRQMRHIVRFAVNMLDGRPPVQIEMDVLFRAMGDQKAEDVLKGLELTWLWLNEVDTLDRSVLRFGLPRCGRYPSAKDGGCQWYGVIADFNAPDIDNWTYELLVEQQLPLSDEALASLREQVGARFGIGFHRQPGGRSADPLPENIKNLPPAYYESMVMGMDENDIRRFVDNEFGAVRNGQPVYPEYNDEFHLAGEELRASPDLPLVCGLDGGRTPAMVFGQYDDTRNQLRVLREVVLYDPIKGKDLVRMGPRAFGEIAAEFAASEFADCELGVVFYDPAIDFGSEDEGYDWLAEFRGEFPAPKFSPGGEAGNRIEPRLESVRRRLTNAPGGKPAILLDPRCRVLRRAMNNGYVFERVEHRGSGTGRFRSVPLKNDFSHVADALAELCLGIQNRGNILNRMRSGAASRAARGGKVDYGTGHFRPAA